MFSKSKGVLLSFLVMALILPVVLSATIGSGNFRLSSQADEVKTVRIWFDPSSITVRTGQIVEVKTMASYDSPKGVIPQIEFIVDSDAGIELVTEKVSYLNSFNGKAEVGTVKFKGLKSGVYKIRIDENSVNSGLPDLIVKSEGINITVRD